MKKIVYFLAVMVAFSFSAFAEMDDVSYRLSSITTNTDSAAYIVRGEIEGVIVEMPTGKTGTVSIVTASGVTLYTGTALTPATDGYVALRYPAQSSAGANLTAITAQAAAANAATNIVYTKIGVAELVTATITPAANTTGTNTYSVKLVVNK
jgi:hypothetical protein